MIISMPTTARSQQRYDHRLRNLVQRTGDVTVATDLGVPRSTARGWLGATPRVVVCLDVADLTELELRQEILKLRRRVQKLTALLRLALALLRTSGFRLTGARLPADAPRCGSCAPWIGPASTCRCERSCGSCVCRRVEAAKVFGIDTWDVYFERLQRGENEWYFAMQTDDPIRIDLVVSLAETIGSIS